MGGVFEFFKNKIKKNILIFFLLNFMFLCIFFKVLYFF